MHMITTKRGFDYWVGIYISWALGICLWHNLTPLWIAIIPTWCAIPFIMWGSALISYHFWTGWKKNNDLA